MKTNKLNQKNFTNAAILALGFTGGMAVSGSFGNLVKAYIPEQEEIGKVGVAGLGLLGGTMIKPSDELGKGLQALSIGVAAKQIYDLGTTAIKGSVEVKPAEDRDVMDHILYGAVGLGCPHATNSLAAPAMNFSHVINRDLDVDFEDTNNVAALLAPAGEEVYSLL